MGLSIYAEKTDLPTFFHFQNTDMREKFVFKRSELDSEGERVYKTINTTDGYSNFIGKTDAHYNALDLGAFWKYNMSKPAEEPLRQMAFFVGTKDDLTELPFAEREVKIDGIRCENPVVCYGLDDDVDLEDRTRKWSNRFDWADGDGKALFKDCDGNARIPTQGDQIEIPAGWNMVLDMATPVYSVVIINGRVTYDISKKGIGLRAEHVFVRGNGELIAGYEDKDSKILRQDGFLELWGASRSQYITKLLTIEAGNKALTNTGRVQLYGKQVTATMTRLTQEVPIDTDVIYVDNSNGLTSGWTKDDVIAIAPTSYDPLHSESFTIKEIDGAKITLTEKTKFKYYGSSDAAKYKPAGVDIRGEVVKLSRSFQVRTAPVCSSAKTLPDKCSGTCKPDWVNIDDDCKLTCENPEEERPWGFQILTTDTYFNGESPKKGHLIADNVEFVGGSQWDTQKTTIRF